MERASLIQILDLIKFCAIAGSCYLQGLENEEEPEKGANGAGQLSLIERAEASAQARRLSLMEQAEASAQERRDAFNRANPPATEPSPAARQDKRRDKVKGLRRRSQMSERPGLAGVEEFLYTSDGYGRVAEDLQVGEVHIWRKGKQLRRYVWLTDAERRLVAAESMKRLAESAARRADKVEKALTIEATGP